MLGGKIHAATVTELDLVNDRTFVNVKFSIPSDTSGTPRALPSTPAAAASPLPHDNYDDAAAGQGSDPTFPARIS